MKKILILLITICSCKSQEHIVITDLNTIGKIKNVKHCHICEGGRFIYKVELTPEITIDYITNDTIKIGQEIYFKTIIE